MRRALIVVVVLAALLVAACGSSKSSSAPSSPVTTALSYFPANSPFVVTIATSPNSTAVKNSRALTNRLPAVALGETALFSKLSQLGIDYNADVRPLFGNPLVAGLVLKSAPGTSNQFVAAWVTKDASKLSALVKKLGPGLQQVGSRDGATVYQLSSLGLAIDGATVVLASNVQALDAALDRHGHGGGISAGDYSRAFSGLPQNGLFQAFGTLTQVLAQPSAAKAQRIPWVAALRGYATTIAADSTGLTFRYRLDTSGRQLTPAQLPFAGGNTPPGFAGTLPIVAAVRDPAQIYAFAESAEQVTNPRDYQQFLKRQAAARAKTGADLSSLVGLATGDLIIDSDTHTTLGRVMVSDPAKARTTIAKLASQPHAVFKNARRGSVTRLSGGFYEIRRPHGKPVIAGVVGNQLVAGQATPAKLRAFAAAPATPAPGAHGAIAFKIALADVIRLASKNPPSAIESRILQMLGTLTGSSTASASQVTGSATLSVK